MNKPYVVANLSFENTKIAFSGKSDPELKKAYWLFKIISKNFLVKIGPPFVSFAINIGLPITGLIKKTIFKHFCGGDSIQDCDKTVRLLGRYGVGTILDYSVEGKEKEETFEATLREIIKTIERAKDDTNIPISVFKLTGIARFALLEKLDAKESLSSKEYQEFEKIKERVDAICRAGYEANVRVFFDAEESWIQDTTDYLALQMMQKYNKEKAIVYNTIQMYRWDRLEYLKNTHKIALADDFYLGVKLVRGAYMEKERKRATDFSYPSPIQPNKEASDQDYDLALHYCVDHIDRISLCAGTHNEASSMLLVDLMSQKGIAKDDKRIYFSQLLGMSDNLSFNLAHAGYNVVKYVPYGPVKAVLPYLFRRAQENTSIAGQTGRELKLLIKEIERRKKEK